MCKRKYITGIIIVFIFGIYKILVLSLLMSGIPIMREHYDIANLIANVIAHFQDESEEMLHERLC